MAGVIEGVKDKLSKKAFRVQISPTGWRRLRRAARAVGQGSARPPAGRRSSMSDPLSAILA
jgi:hypothetical protein